MRERGATPHDALVARDPTLKPLHIRSTSPEE